MARDWTEATRKRLEGVVSLDTWLPRTMPEYAQGFFYMLGSLTASSFAVLVGSGLVLAMNGPGAWAINTGVRYVAAVHFWAVQAFFFFMMLHLWRVYFTGAWRDGRGATWVLGAVAFLVAIPTAFTGFLINGDLYAQWNAVQAKDGLNALGLGWFNLTNAGQMAGMHMVVLPLVLSLVMGAHITRVRLRGVVPPYPRTDADVKRREHSGEGEDR